MVKSAFNVNTSNAKRWFHDQHKNIPEYERLFAMELTRLGTLYMKRIIPVDKGVMKNSTHWEMLDGKSAQIYTSANYARYVNDGTRPHIIQPKKEGGVLAFPPFGARMGTHGGHRVSGVLMGGHKTGLFKFGKQSSSVGLVFARVVHHPGTKPTHFIQKTVKHMKTNDVKTAAENVIKKHGLGK